MILHSARAIALRPSTVTVLAGLAFGSLPPPQAEAFVEIARGELLVNVDARITTDSNVFGNLSEIDDTVFSVEPSLAYVRRQGRLNVDGRAGVRFNRYSDLDSEDSNDRFARVETTFPTVQGSPLQGSVYLDYFRGRRIDIYLTDRIDVNDFSIGGEGSYRFNPRTEVRFGADVLRSDPGEGPENRSRSFRIGFGYGIRPQATAYVDLRTRRSSSDRNLVSGFEIDRKENAVLVGVNGQLSPVLSGYASVGFQTSEATGRDSGGDFDTFIADAALSWQVRQRTQLYLNATADNRNTNDARTVERILIAAGVKQEIGRAFSFDGRVELEDFTFRGTPSTSDEQISYLASLQYAATKYFTAGVEFTYWERDPEITQRFDRTTFALFGTFRY